MKMMKTPLSLVPWSLVLSLYLLPPSFVSAQDISDDTEADQPESNAEVEGQVDGGTEDVQEVQAADAPQTSEPSEPSVDSEQNSALDQGALETTADSTFDPRRQMASAEGVQTATVQDIAAFKQSYKRYKGRINDFRQETLLMVELQRQEAFDILREQYTKPLSLLEEQQIQQRSTAIERFERFIAKYPKEEEGAGIRFQLADIYFKMAEEAFIIAQEELSLKMDENPDLEMEVSKDLDRAFTLYKEIVDVFPDSDVVDGAMYMMAWCYSDAESELYDGDLAAQYYKRVIEEYPESRFVAQSSYFVGQYYFNENDNETALLYFQQATDLSKPDAGSFNSLYEYANYRLAWTHYLLNDYDKALELFTLHQDYSERKKRDTGIPSNTLEESFEYTALSFADLAELENKQSVDIAKEYYETVGERDYTSEVFVYMAEELIEQVRVLEAIDTYQYLQQKWPYDPKNPTYQKKLAELYLKEGEVDAYMDEMKILTDRYAENGDWWVQNRNNPEAQDIARGYVEISLLDVAYNQYNRAFESQDPEDYLAAVESFDRFLRRFPFAEEYYDVMWYMADALMSGAQISEALEQYRTLVKTSPDHQRGELAQLKVLNITNGQAYNRLSGNFVMLPNDSEVKDTLTLENGESIEVYELPVEALAFIQAYQDSAALDYDIRLLRIDEEMAELERQATEKADRKMNGLQSIIEEVNGAKQFFEDSLKSYQYNIGQIYFGHRQYELAREYFNLVIDAYPQSQEATFASNLIISSYQKEMNWAMVQAEARRFIALALGPDGVVPEDFAKYEQNATLQLLIDQQSDAQALMAKGEVEEATQLFNLTADGLLGYLNDYDGLSVDEAANLLLLSGNVYEEGGNIERANAVYRDFVDRYPSNKASRSILFSIATNHQNALELEEAIKYFDILYNQTYGKGVEYADGISALYNSALLKIGLGQYKAAAEGLEFYAKKFSDQPDAEQAFYLAGEQWEKIADWRALDFYTRYLKRFKGEDPDHTMMAHYRRIELYRNGNKNKKREIEREWKSLLESYTMMQADGKDSAKMRQYAAEYYLREIPQKLEEFKSVKYTRDDEKNAALVKSQLAALDALRTYCSKPGEDFQDFEAIVAGRYCAGSAELHLAQFFEVFPIPDNLVPGDEDASFNAQVVFEEQLAKIWEPLREGAIVTLEQTLALSEKQGRWTKWTQYALDDLSALDPKSYPPQKQEVVYSASSVFVPPAGPISMDSPNGVPQIVQEQKDTTDQSTETEQGTLDTNDESLDSSTPEGAENDMGWGEPTQDVEQDVPEDGTEPEEDDATPELDSDSEGSSETDSEDPQGTGEQE